MPVVPMQDEVTRVCQALKDNFQDDEIENPVFTLTKILQRMIKRPADLSDIMRYIDERDTQRTAPAKKYSTILKDELCKMRTNPRSVTCTEKIKAGQCMCLFVCGLLETRDMHFGQLYQSHKEYADKFFDAVIAFMNEGSEPVEITVIEGTASDAKFTALSQKPAVAAGTSFLCAHEGAPQNLSHDNTLVLDIFHDHDQYVLYDPVVWYPFCLWAFTRNATGSVARPLSMCCYGVSTGRKSFLFIANYEPNAETLLTTPNRTDVMALEQLIERPLAMYRNTLTLFDLQKQPAAVISRIYPVAFQAYMPLVYVHLFVRPESPLYIDTQFNAEVQTMLLFAVGRDERYVIDHLPYTPQQTYTVMKVDDPSPQAYALLAAAHYDLMMGHTFVTPSDATQDEILFDTLDPGQISRHRDHIAAVCDVRYNWMFDPAYAPVWVPTQALAADAPFHAIDVHRHITHLQSSSATQSDLMKTLSTGFQVTGKAGIPGVIIFDVQAHGRALGLFDHDTTPTAVGLDCVDALQVFVKARIKTSETGKQNRVLMFNAINRYFKDRAKWSLCDMAYKYVVLLDGSTDMVVQDSYALTLVPGSAPSCSRCPFCPACYIDPPAAVPGQDTMHSHIVDMHQDAYYIADAKSFAVMTPPVSIAGSTTQSAATSAAASVAASSSGPSVAVSSTSSFDPDRKDPSTASHTSSEDEAFAQREGTRTLTYRLQAQNSSQNSRTPKRPPTPRPTCPRPTTTSSGQNSRQKRRRAHRTPLTTIPKTHSYKL
jgi:hypothetical protein